MDGIENNDNNLNSKQIHNTVMGSINFIFALHLLVVLFFIIAIPSYAMYPFLPFILTSLVFARSDNSNNRY